MTRKLCSLFLSALLMPTLSACATTLEYSAEPIEAWVVDAETNEPLEGVVVIADWVLEGGISVNNFTKVNRVGNLVIMETVTDKSGRFHFPAWGPKRTAEGILDDKDPRLLLFKSGYEYVEVSNSQYSRPMKYSDMGKRAGIESKPRGPLRISFWSGERVKMKRFSGTLKEYSSVLNFIKGSLRFVEENCNWKKTPVILIALDKQRQIFRANGIDSGIYSLDYFDGLSDKEVKKCGLPSDFFKEQKK